LAAAAWIDGELHPLERTYLIRTLDSMPGITGADCAAMSKLLSSPMEADAREQAVYEVLEVIQTEKDKALVLDLLGGMIAADGVVHPSEAALLDEVRQALEDKSTNVLRRLSRLLIELVRGRPDSADGDAH